MIDLKYNNKILKFIKDNWLYLLLFLLMFVVLVYCHNNTFLANDDLPYSFFKRLNNRVSNLFEIVWDNLRYYKSTNGRFIVHCIVMFLLMFGKNIWSICNPIIILLIFYVIIKFINSKSKLNNILVLLLSFSLFLAIYEYKSIIYWVAGSVNYIWVLVFLFIFSYFVLRKNILNNKILSSILLFFISSLHENSFVYLIVFVIIYSIIKIIKEKSSKYFLFLIPVILGGAVLLLAPGNLGRNSGYIEWYSLSFFERLNISIPAISDSIYKFLCIDNIVPTIFTIIIYLKLLSLKTNKNREFVIKLLFIIVVPILLLLYYICPFKYLTFIIAISLFIIELFIHIIEKDYDLIPLQFSFYAVSFSMIVTPLYNSFRPNIYIYVYYIFIICLFLTDLIKNLKTIKKLIFVIIILFSIAILYNEVIIYYNIGKVQKIRENEIKEFNEVKSENTLYLTKIPDKYAKYHNDSNSVNEDFWTYNWYVWYYHIKEGTLIRYK